jgi:hypothetical protein
VERFLTIVGELFLAEAEKPEYEQLTAEDAKLEWLVVSISRLLQTTDYAFGPHEAYWLGLVDEVCGSSLPNVREATVSQNQNLLTRTGLLMEGVIWIRAFYIGNRVRIPLRRCSQLG